MLGFGFGPQEMIIMAVVLLLLFGSARLPSLMRNMGRSVNEFKAGMSDKPSERIGDDSAQSGIDAEAKTKNEAETVSNG